MENLKDEKFKMVVEQIISWKMKEDIDDTLVQKFLSIIEESTVNLAIFILPDIEEQISKLSQKDANPQALAFVFQLGTILILKNVILNIIGLVEVLNIKSYQAIVRDSYWNYVTKVCVKEKLNSKWFDECSDIINTALNCLNDESLFVRRSVEKFVTTFIENHIEKEKNFSWIIQRILNLLAYNDYREGCLNCLYTILKNETSENLCILNDKLNVTETLIKMIQSSNRTEIICKTLSLFCDKSLINYQHIYDKLIEKSHLVELVSFANFIIENDSTCEFEFQNVLKTLILPIKYYVERNEGMNSDNLLERSMHLIMSQKSLYRSILIKSFCCQSKLVQKFDSKTKIMLMDNTLLFVFKIMDSPNDMKDHKLLNSAIDLILQLVKNIDFEFQDEKVIDLLLKLLENSSIQSSLYHSLSTIISILLKGKYQQHTDTFWTKLGQILSRRTLDYQWEIRDSSLEIISNAASIMKGNIDFSKWLLQFNFHLLIWDLISQEEVESYIRATSLSILTVLCQDTLCWEALQKQHDASSEVVASLLSDLLINDEEMFVQRASINSIHDLLNVKFIDEQSVFKAVSWAAEYSLDWEVKLKVLCIIENLVQEQTKSILKEQITDVLIKFQNMGYLHSLLILLNDCDRPVKLKAASIAKQLVVQLQSVQFEPPEMIGCFKENSRETPIENVEMMQIDSEVIDSVLDQEMRDKIKFLVNPNKEKVKLEINFEDWDDWTISINKIWQFDTEAVINEANKSTDVYANDIEPILDDIIAATHFLSDSDVEAQITDCY